MLNYQQEDNSLLKTSQMNYLQVGGIQFLFHNNIYLFLSCRISVAFVVFCNIKWLQYLNCDAHNYVLQSANCCTSFWFNLFFSKVSFSWAKFGWSFIKAWLISNFALPLMSGLFGVIDSIYDIVITKIHL